MNLSEREWTVLDALWSSGGAALGDLVETLRPATGWSRSTVFTYLTRMEAKGLVAIDKEGYPLLRNYSPVCCTQEILWRHI